MLSFEEFTGQVLDGVGIEMRSQLTRSASLIDELGFDSLQVFELLLVIEDLAAIESPPSRAPDVHTLDDAYTYYRSLAAASVQDGKDRPDDRRPASASEKRVVLE